MTEIAVRTFVIGRISTLMAKGAIVNMAFNAMCALHAMKIVSIPE